MRKHLTFDDPAGVQQIPATTKIRFHTWTRKALVRFAKVAQGDGFIVSIHALTARTQGEVRLLGVELWV